MPAKRKEGAADAFMHQLEIRAKYNDRPKPPERPLRDEARIRKAESLGGYVKRGEKLGTVDSGNPGASMSTRGSMIMRDPLSGRGSETASAAFLDFATAISDALARPGVSMPHTDLVIPRAKRKGASK